jgi:hypothetical protein
MGSEGRSFAVMSGGYNGSAVLDDIWVLDLNSLSWSLVTLGPRYALMMHSINYDDGMRKSFYIIGMLMKPTGLNPRRIKGLATTKQSK